jgi:Transglutaminase-like superfamily
MKKLRKFLQWSWSDRFLLFQTFVLLNLIRLGLWAMSFRRLLKLWHYFRSKYPNIQPSNPHPISKIIWAIDCSSNYSLGTPRCLVRAIAAQILLHQQGYRAELCIGVSKGESGKFEAHAWLTYQKQVIIGYLKDLPLFVPLPSLENMKL